MPLNSIGLDSRLNELSIPITPKSEFGRRSYDLPKLEVIRSQPRRADLNWPS